MGKRKRRDAQNGDPLPKVSFSKKPRSEEIPSTAKPASLSTQFTIQIIAGSYDRILHGVTATVQPDGKVSFADTFLFNAHTSAIRCLAISPPSAPVPGQAQKVFLASGSTDERINVYNLSAHAPSQKNQERQRALAGIAPRPILENKKNRELGTLHHHSSTITALGFPTRGKLVSTSEDSTVGITRTRDWSLLSTIKAPVPKPKGMASGDPSQFGATPAGVNDFAVHPSLKTMITVSKGERCMRLWNLVTGKKAGVLNFAKDVLREAGEGRHSTGEGRKVVWGATEDGDEFAVAFDRDVVVFGMNAVVKCRVMGPIKTKVHELCYLPINKETEGSLLVVSTEDGRILFFSTREEDLSKPETATEGQAQASVPVARLVASVGGKDAGVTSRVKDFTILRRDHDALESFYIVAGSSDGKLRLWKVGKEELEKPATAESAANVGKMMGMYETQNRITCIEAFEMIPRPDGVEDSEDEEEGAWEDEDGEDDEESEVEEVEEE